MIKKSRFFEILIKRSKFAKHLSIKTESNIKYYVRVLFLSLLPILAAACRGFTDGADSIPGSPVELSFGIAGGNDGTKTSIDDNGISTSWSSGDMVYLWAYDNATGETVIDRTGFSSLGQYGNTAIFSAQLPSPMPEGEYTYYACYPAPESINGTALTYTLPAVQNGQAGDGADIMLSGPSVGKALKQYKLGDKDNVNLGMKHMMHILKFYLPAGSTGLNGESIKKVVINVSKPVVGTVTVDRDNPESTAVLTNGTSRITLKMNKPLTPAYGGGRNYTFAAICPTSFTDGGTMDITLYSDSWIGTVRRYHLAGRDFKAGHTTPVKLDITRIDPYYSLNFKFVGNNLGENIQKITLTADDSSLRFGDDGINTYSFDAGGDIAIGEELSFLYQDVETYLAMGGHKITVTYESEHIRSRETLSIPDLNLYRSYAVGMTVPYLLNEDFSTLTGISSHDEYQTWETGNRDPVSFLNGWTGARIGGQAGTSIRLAPRRETSARYHSRVDSAPLTGDVIKPVNVRVTFDYGAAEKHGGLGSKQYPTHFWVGYVRKTQGYKGDATDGTFGSDNTINENSGSWTYLPNKMNVEMQLPAVDANNPVNRISIRAEVENHAGMNNNTNWLYIDNVKVTVIPNK